MMLNSEMPIIFPQEASELFRILPNITGKRVLELGAGIGCDTCSLAGGGAKTILGLDYMHSFIMKNRELHLEESSFDAIFANWLFMYLSDAEIEQLFQKFLVWLRPGGVLFFHELIFNQSGNKSWKSDQVQYRDSSYYNSIINHTCRSLKAGDGYEAFEIVFSKSVQSFTKLKGNPNQICWLVEKVNLNEGDAHGFRTFQEFLDSERYSKNGIFRYEKICGEHFISTGGKDTTAELVAILNLRQGDCVLDVGSGIGGSAFYMAEKYDVNVLGIDLSSNMVAIGMEKLNKIQDKRVQFEVSDATKREFAPESFDVVYSRETILHIKDKKALFSKFYTWLKQGGKLLISDYCWSDGEHSDVFKQHVKQRGYNLLSPKQYGELVASVGFQNVIAEDRTTQFVYSLKRELQRVEVIKEEFIEEFTKSDYDAIVGGWNDKVYHCSLGEQRWGLFYAEKI